MMGIKASEFCYCSKYLWIKQQSHKLLATQIIIQEKLLETLKLF